MKILNCFLINEHVKEILKGSSTAFILKIFGMISGYFFIFIISHVYGAHGLGIYSLSLSTLYILGIIGTMGFETAIIRFIGQFSAEGNLYKIVLLYKNMLKLVIPFSCLGMIILYLFSNPLAVNIFHHDTLSIAFQIVSLIVPFYVINTLNIELIRGFKNIALSEYLRNVNTVIFSIFLLLVLNTFAANNYAPIIALSLAVISTFGISSYCVAKKIKSIPKNILPSLPPFKILKISFPMMVVAFSILIMGSVDTIMIGAFSTIENVGIYNIALRLASITSFALYAINTIAAPKFSELYWSKKNDDLKTTISYSAKLIFWMSVPILILFLFFPIFFLSIFGEEFIQGKYALIFLTIGQFVNAASGSVGYFLNMTGRQSVFRNIIIIATLTNILLNYIFIPKYGITGAALATMISISFWNITATVYTKIKINIRTFYIPILCK